MNRKTKGKILEAIVVMVEKALSDDSEVSIIPNFKKKDTDGIVREIDVYIETKRSGRTFSIAIECKNYKKSNPISLEKIDAFISKCDKLNINYKIYVTTSKFQSGAIEKAKKNNIDLIEVSTRQLPQSTISEKFNIQKSILINREFDFKKIRIESIQFSKHLNDCDTFYENQKLFDEKGKEISIDFLQKDIVEKNSEIIYSYLFTKIGILFNYKKLIFPTFDCKNIFLKKKGNFYSVDKLHCCINIWYKLNENTFEEIQEYKEVISNKVLASFITNEITLFNNKFTFNIVKNASESIQHFLSHKTDAEKVMELKELSKLPKGFEIKKEKIIREKVEPKYLEYSITDNVVDSITSNSSNSPKEKLSNNLLKKNRKDSRVLIVAETINKKLYFFLPLIKDKAMYTSKFPDPINLFFSQALDQIINANEYKERFPLSLQNEIKNEDINILIDDTYYKYFKAKISSLVFLRMAVEGVINSLISPDSQVQIESKPETIFKLGVLEKTIKKCKKRDRDAILKLFQLSDKFMNLKISPNESSFPNSHIDHFEELENCNIETLLKASKDFINFYKPNYINIISGN